MALDFNKIEEPDDSVFPVKFEDESNLDMYGVWVKKRPEKEGDTLPIENDTAEDPFENDKQEFDSHDVVNLDNDDEPLEFEDLTTSNNFETTETEVSEDISEDESVTFENDIYGDEFDIFDESDAVVIDEEKYSFDTDLDEMPKTDKDADETVSDINNFETLDLDDFLDTDETIESSSEKEAENKDENAGSESDDNIKLDLSFDEDYMETKENNAIDFEGNDNFEITADEHEENKALEEEKSSDTENLPERTIEDISDFDDILDDLESKDKPEEEKAEELTENIPFNITIDEYSDITSLTGETMGSDDDLEDVEIFSDISEFEEVENVKDTAEEKQENDDLVIESTIIEAGNIEEIRKENQKIMEESSPTETEGDESADDFDSILDSVMNEETETAEKEETIAEKNDIFFDDIGALENDLLDAENDDIPEEFIEASQEIQSNNKADDIQSDKAQSNVIANDKATEILTQIASELVSIKNELANMKSEMAQTQQKLEKSTIFESKEAKVNNENIKNVNDSDKSGFFNDDDGDETIALTGDELNNILITADFTEENTEKEYEIPETLDKIDGQFLDDSEEENGNEKDEIFTDENILNDVEPEHINALTQDISYLDEDSIDEDISFDTIEEQKDENTEETPQIEDFISDEITDDPIFEEKILDTPAEQDSDTTEENNSIEDFDLKITELELPDGQSIPLGDEYGDFNAITDNIEEGHDEASDFEDSKFIDNHEDAVFSAEELDQTAQDIPRLELDESAAKEQKIQTETLPIHLKDEIKSVLTYMDQLLESLPEEKIEEFAKSEYFDTYKRLFDELGIS